MRCCPIGRDGLVRECLVRQLRPLSSSLGVLVVGGSGDAKGNGCMGHQVEGL